MIFLLWTLCFCPLHPSSGGGGRRLSLIVPPEKPVVIKGDGTILSGIDLVLERVAE